MTITRMLFREMWQRKGASLLAALTIAVAVGLFVALLALNRALQQQTVQQMKALGFNLAILPAEVTPENYLSSEFGDHDMPDTYAETLARADKITADHFSGRLEKRIDWEGRTAILTGVMATRVREQKAPLGFKTPPAPGTVYCGFEIARLVEVAKDADGKPLLDKDGSPKLRPIRVLGESFAVAKRLARQDIKDDMRIYLNLADTQRLLNKPGRIHAIEALGCRCEGNVVAQIQKELEGLLNRQAKPGDRVKVLIPDEPKYYTREKMRARVEGYAAIVIPGVLLACVIWIGALSYMNVRQRREEIGLLRAVGVGSRPIAALFLGKAALLGLLGAAAGFALGTAAVHHYGPAVFELPPGSIKPVWPLLVWTLVLTPAMTMLAGAVATVAAVTIDPAEALREE